MKKKILFICLGNICRSVAAEGMLKKKAQEAGRASDFEIDSAGLIDYHEGELADPRMRAAAKRRGINLTHLSRPITQADFDYFDLIIAMDTDNVRRLDRIRPAGCHAQVVLAKEYFTKPWPQGCVPDPYYSSDSAFEYCLDQLEDVCDTILEKE